MKVRPDRRNRNAVPAAHASHGTPVRQHSFPFGQRHLVTGPIDRISYAVGDVCQLRSVEGNATNLGDVKVRIVFGNHRISIHRLPQFFRGVRASRNNGIWIDNAFRVGRVCCGSQRPDRPDRHGDKLRNGIRGWTGQREKRQVGAGHQEAGGKKPPRQHGAAHFSNCVHKTNFAGNYSRIQRTERHPDTCVGKTLTRT